jgi:hypothetical protein
MPANSRGSTVAGMIVPFVFMAGAVAVAGAGAGAAPHFPKPTTYRVDPEPSCNSEIARVHYPPGKSGPRRRRIVVPGRPGLTAVAVSGRTIRINWTVARVGLRCRSAYLLLSVGHYQSWLPITVSVQTRGRLTGSKRVTVPAFGPAPDIAIASALTARGGRSRIAGVLIRH